MTAQIAEGLILNGEEVSLLTNPLNSYFALGGANPGFSSNSTALWRGYVGTWKIVNDRLYLIELQGTLEEGGSACLETVFPGFPARVFAHWYSGTLRIPRGKLVRYRHMGYGSKFERDELIAIRSGIVVSTKIIDNGDAPSGAKEGYRVGAMTVFPRQAKNGNEK